MEHAKELLPVGRLNFVPSPFRVRWNAPGQVEAGDALIGALRLLHPLIANSHAAGRGEAPELRFAVTVGEPRRRVVQLNQLRWRPARLRPPAGCSARAGELNPAV